MPQKVKISLSFVFVLVFLGSGIVQAQTPRPTPTNMPAPTPSLPPTNTPVPSPTPKSAPANTGNSQANGYIFGAVYEDVNGDGQCIGTGIAGEDPLTGVNVEFSTEFDNTPIVLQSGSDGSFGLAGVGPANWSVSAKPDANWVVTSAKTLKAPVTEETPVVTNVNFCLAQSTAVTVILPESGGSRLAGQFLLWAFSMGAGLLLLGVGRRWRENRA